MMLHKRQLLPITGLILPVLVHFKRLPSHEFRHRGKKQKQEAVMIKIVVKKRPHTELMALTSRPRHSQQCGSRGWKLLGSMLLSSGLFVFTHLPLLWVFFSFTLCQTFAYWREGTSEWAGVGGRRMPIMEKQPLGMCVGVWRSNSVVHTAGDSLHLMSRGLKSAAASVKVNIFDKGRQLKRTSNAGWPADRPRWK